MTVPTCLKFINVVYQTLCALPVQAFEEDDNNLGDWTDFDSMLTGQPEKNGGRVSEAQEKGSRDAKSNNVVRNANSKGSQRSRLLQGLKQEAVSRDVVEGRQVLCTICIDSIPVI